MLRSFPVALVTAIAMLTCGVSAQNYTVIEIDPSVAGGTNSRAFDVNDLGQVVGAYETAQGLDHGFRWINGILTDLGPSNDRSSLAFAINTDGTVVGEAEDLDGDITTFRWIDPGPMDLITVLQGDSLNFEESGAQDINDSGAIVGWAYQNVGGYVMETGLLVAGLHVAVTRHPWK